MLLTVLIILIAPFAVILAIAAAKPSTFRVERRTTIRAGADRVFAAIDDFHQWAAWSPWEKLDPAMNRTHSGSPSGRGAIYAWQGNKKVGEGRMEIVESTPFSKLVVKLDFLKPFEAHNTAEFVLSPSAGGGTDVSWAMYGHQPFMNKVFTVIVSMDKLVGRDFDRGLENLRRITESTT